MATRPLFRPRSRNRSATVAPGAAPLLSPFTEIVITVSIDLPCGGYPWLGAQVKVQISARLPVGGFNHQCAVRSVKTGHVKCEPCVSVRAGGRGKLRGLRGPVDSSNHMRAGYAVSIVFLKNRNLQRSAPAGEPS